MKKIYKYPLAIDDFQHIPMPKGAVILHVGNQRESLNMWALVDPDKKLTELRAFRVAGTGRHIACFILDHAQQKTAGS